MADFIPETAEDQVDDHVWAFDRLAGFLAGGLTTAERLRMQRHLATCDECRKTVAGLEAMDARIRRLFAKMQPPTTLEDRTVQALRATSAKPEERRRAAWTWPMKGMLAVAGVMLLVGIGALLSEGLDGFPGPIRMANSLQKETNDNLRQGPVAIHNYHADADLRKDPYLTTDVDPAGAEFDTDINYNMDRKADVSVPGVVNPKETVGILNGDASEPGRSKSRQNWREKLEPSSRTDLELRSPAGKDPVKKEWSIGVTESAPLGYRVENQDKFGDVKDAPPPQGVAVPGGFGNKGSVTSSTGSQAGRSLGRSGAIGSGGGLGGGLGGEGKDTGKSEGKFQFWTGMFRDAPPAPTTMAPPPSPGSGPPVAMPSAPVAGMDAGINFTYGAPPAVPTPAPAPKSAPVGETYFRPGESAPRADSAEESKAIKDQASERDRLFEAERKGTLLHRNQELEFAVPGQEKALDNLNKKAKNPVQEAAEDQQRAEKALVAQADKTNNPDKTPALPQVRRIIIRSGDIEFEVDSFDAAVAGIFRIIAKTKDGFVATVNSDKLANGKMKGSVVVRMPPERLDEFVLELRQTLGKNGDLKGQRIGSEDVTKRYTDLESELKAPSHHGNPAPPDCEGSHGP